MFDSLMPPRKVGELFQLVWGNPKTYEHLGKDVVQCLDIVKASIGKPSPKLQKPPFDRIEFRAIGW